MNLEELRQEINQIDDELVVLLEKRMKLVSQVAAYKQETCLLYTSRILLEKFHDIPSLAQAEQEEIASIDSLGVVIAKSLHSYFAQEGTQILLKELEEAGVNLAYLGEKVAEDAVLSGKTVVLTGKLETLTRTQAKEKLLRLGANVAGSRCV